MSLQLLAAAAQDSTHALGHTEPPDATALSAASAASAESALRKKRRSRRACDKCNLSRTRCNNENPWYVQSHARGLPAVWNCEESTILRYLTPSAQDYPGQTFYK